MCVGHFCQRLKKFQANRIFNLQYQNLLCKALNLKLIRIISLVKTFADQFWIVFWNARQFPNICLSNSTLSVHIEYRTLHDI